MADVLNVNPTRMELGRLKKRLATARRGHKLLKDKCDELMKTFLESVKENKELRIKTEKRIADIHASFTVAAALTSSEVLEEALVYPKNEAELSVSTKNIMSVNVPEYDFRMKKEADGLLSYGFAFTAAELDDAAAELDKAVPDLLRLAEAEKRSQMLAEEIEKTRRRVNALEYTMIPQLENTIKVITMKLSENERGNLTRLMKVKDMMIKQARQSEQV
ncbi:MAG: V-type ATP synthase subunit D [Clostridiales bacterium]|nr:MAG: V-type ATP synthase subunit D [Clostridiales bacterium]